MEDQSAVLVGSDGATRGRAANGPCPRQHGLKVIFNVVFACQFGEHSPARFGVIGGSVGIDQ